MLDRIADKASTNTSLVKAHTVTRRPPPLAGAASKSGLIVTGAQSVASPPFASAMERRSWSAQAPSARRQLKANPSRTVRPGLGAFVGGSDVCESPEAIFCIRHEMSAPRFSEIMLGTNAVTRMVRDYLVQRGSFAFRGQGSRMVSSFIACIDRNAETGLHGKSGNGTACPSISGDCDDGLRSNPGADRCAVGNASQ